MEPQNLQPLPLSRGQRLVRELRRHAYGYAVVAAMAVAGAFLAPLVLPAATFWHGLFGGFALGVYAALTAVPDKFLE
ncbi:MAG: hypothetical protein MJE66_21685 [Proteobacteria bacterium]|nr:hypothetical protein [Pseudomonadota bacterium]